MARLRVRFVRRFPTFLDELTVFSGMDFLILSAYETPEIQMKLQALCDLGNTVQLHVFSAKEADHAFKA